MFEDDPPPLPPATCIETLCDGTFADLSDRNRFTAVADDDYNGNDAEFRLHMSAVLQTKTDSELVNCETALPHTEFIEASETADRAHNLVTETLLHSNYDGKQNPLSSSLRSRSPQFARCSKLQHSSPEILSCPEESDVVKSFVTAHFVKEDGTINNGAHDIPVFEKGREELISIENMENETEDSSKLENIGSNGRNEKAKVMQSTLESDEEDDEFGDFEKFAKTEKIEENENDNWANFESSSLPDMENKSIADFSFSEPEFQLTAENPLLPSLLENLCNDQLWTAVAGDEESNDEPHDPHDSGIYETLNDAINTKDKNRPDEMLWIAVSIIEEALALKLQWHNSLIRSCFLHSLDIDVNQTVVRNSDLPVFAQQLEESSVLAPVSVVESCAGVTLADEKNSLPQSNSAEFLPHADIKRSSIGQQAPSRSITVDSLAVPPVHFDWNNSGLTNPLKAGLLNISSASLDLDFLVSTSSKGLPVDGSPTVQMFSTLQKDLTAFGLNFPDDAGSSKSEKDIPSNTQIVLDYVLNKNGDKRKYKPVSELSLDARALHDQLPDLDYMLSNVLLFPVVDR
ncbi:unnamed protein product [Wuchereria bancrofti]|uniref:Aftiphilin clathrin-binding box domain-containing protein n=2 Tax=Wuchereria bancrofti TaxID=6293 RepID=A0A183XMA9_WUCBA|nr:unnamed protein product [Wuchereria bancrofti]